jgi:hypothetical protein
MASDFDCAAHVRESSVYYRACTPSVAATSTCAWAAHAWLHQLQCTGKRRLCAGLGDVHVQVSVHVHLDRWLDFQSFPAKLQKPAAGHKYTRCSHAERAWLYLPACMGNTSVATPTLAVRAILASVHV